MLISQFCSFISITTGLILMCVTSNLITAKPNPSRALYPLSRREISLARCEQPHLKNGIARLKQRRKMVRFDCSRGYQLLGSRYAACSGGKWDTPIPVCTKKGCPKLDSPEHGFFMEERSGLMVTLFCKDTYQAAGNIIAYCDGDMWDRELGTCRETSVKPQTWCDFETEDLCRWVHDDTDDFDWKRFTTFQANIVHTGPKVDTTYKEPLKGHYMLLESTDGIEDERARLISPLYDAIESINACFSMHYYMYGATVGTLRVYVKPMSVDMETALHEERYLFFNKSGNQRNLWHNTTINIDQYNEPFQIIIEGSPGSGHLGDIAIDDVAIFQGTRCAKEEIQLNKQNKTESTDNRQTIFDYQSCKARCDEKKPTDAEDIMQAEGIIKKCDCHPECEDIKSCCPDYRNVCAFSTSDSTESEVIVDYTEKSIFAQTMQPSTEVYKATTNLKKVPIPGTVPTSTTSKKSSPLEATVHFFDKRTSTKPKTSSSKTTPTTTTTTTTSTTTTTTTTVATIPIVKQVRTSTRNPPVTSTQPQKSNGSDIELVEQLPEKVTAQIEDFPDEPDTSKHTGIMMQDDANTGDIVNIHIFEPSTSEKESSDPGPFPLVAILFSLLVIAVILTGTTFALKYYHRHCGPENYKKNAELANRRHDRTNGGEFSDVLYLTEQIDFTMQTQQS